MTNFAFEPEWDTDGRSLTAVKALRRNVFEQEYGARADALLQGGIDIYDQNAYQVNIWAAAQPTFNGIPRSLAGTYRLIHDSDPTRFYSNSEFFIAPLLAKLEGSVVELSRACVAPRFRSGSVIAMLWSEIIRYLHQHEVRWVFGMASIPCAPGDAITRSRQIVEWIEAHELWSPNTIASDQRVAPRRGYRPDDSISSERLQSVGESEVEIPSLVTAYLKAGAKFCSTPAYDAEFRCLDLLTLIDIDCLPSRFSRRAERVAMAASGVHVGGAP